VQIYDKKIDGLSQKTELKKEMKNL